MLEGDFMEQVNSIDEFIAKLERYNTYSDVFYRGQLEKHQNITSSLSRDPGYIQNEHAIFHEAIMMKSVEFDGYSEPIAYLSKMQHYGIPTRLIDLSVDPLIALFFAVQNVNDESAGNVFVFIQPKLTLNDNKVRLLSILATLNSYDLENIEESYLRQFGENISKSQILEYASDCAFVEHSDELKLLNSRLYNQKGAFAICGNDIEQNNIIRSIKPLNSITPSMIIRIPYEQKYSVKKELDEKYRINETTIFPEFPSIADYLKEKYKQISFEPFGTFNIIEAKNLSINGAKRISVIAVPNHMLRIEEIKQVCRVIIEQYNMKYDVIWVYIAKTGDDYIMRNWIISCQWISTSLNSKYRPSELSRPDEKNCRWRYEKSYSTLNEYYSQCVFDDDKNLFVYHEKILAEIRQYFVKIWSALGNGDFYLLTKFMTEHREEIKHAYYQINNFGHSRNILFEKYIDRYLQFISNLDDVSLWIERDDLNEHSKNRFISESLKKAKSDIEFIEMHSSEWRVTIGLTDSEYAKIDPKDYRKIEYQYKPTLPINPNALDIWFKIQISKYEDNKFFVNGTTNLFDDASLMISITNAEGYLLGQSKSDVLDGHFEFGLFTHKGKGYPEATYVANVSLSIPSVQNKKFISKAGIEYENITGIYVNRNGIGPSVNYYYEFCI